MAEFFARNWWLIGIAAAMHVTYAARHRVRWARALIDALKRFSPSGRDQIVLAWLLTADFFLLVVMLLPRR